MQIPYSDQSALFNPDAWAWPVHIVGLGSVGSTLFLPLLKVGVHEVHLWDDDRVEVQNIPVQLTYRPSDIGLTKAAALAAFAARQETDALIVAHEERVTAVTELEGVVMCGVHTMAARSEIWEAVKGNPLIPLYMDGRIAGEEVHLYSLDPADPRQCDDYETTLYSDDDASPESCGERNIIHSPLQVATWMISGLTLVSRGESPKSSLLAGLRRMQYS